MVPPDFISILFKKNSFFFGTPRYFKFFFFEKFGIFWIHVELSVRGPSVAPHRTITFCAV